ncbi:MAG: hypothetical protein JXQ75_22165 [Phycisphaerae bacterium]|nr:hypothetical protein [Phycisphaerae bacterium]
MRKILALTILVSTVVGSSGCGTAAKRVLKEVQGASSEARAVPGTHTATLATYQAVKIDNPRSDLGGLVDSRFSGVLLGALRGALTEGEEPVFRGGSPVLEIQPEITFYSEAGGLGSILGSDSYAVVLFWLSADGAPVGKVQVVTKSGASRTGEADMAKSMADGLAGFMKKHRKKN